jgi:hypothetical protein
VLRNSAELIARECEPDAWLQRHIGGGDQHLHQHVTPQDLLDAIRRRADGHYRELWEACSTPEKLVLAQLAEEGVVNLRNREALAELIRKGLVVRDPHPRIMNQSFRGFVLAVETGLGVKELEHASAGGWDTVRHVVWPALLVAGLFLLLTQRKYFNDVVPYVAALGTELAALFKTFGGFRSLWSSVNGGPQGSGPQEG